MEVRRRRIATRLLQTLKTEELFANVTAMGLASSHPASCTALATYASKSSYFFLSSSSFRVLLGLKLGFQMRS